MPKVDVDLNMDIPEHLEDFLTFQTVQILREALKEGYCYFEADDSELSYRTVEQLSEIVAPSGGYFLKKDSEYNFTNWQNNCPDSGVYVVIFPEKTNIDWN